MPRLRHPVLRILSAVLVALAVRNSLASAQECGPVPLPGAAGPYDYVDSKFAWNLTDVTENHWVHVQRALAEREVHYALRELNWILIRWPNHYPALFELGRIEQLYPGVVFDPSKFSNQDALFFPPTPECYFDRAFRYRPKDPTLRMLFGLYYHKSKRLQDALTQYQKAEAMDPEASEIQYNLGLVYFDLKDYEPSIQHAQKAYKLGYPLAGLRKKLTAAGKWPATTG
jgi:tetratricopeptide (TPR) repeat protein